MADELTWPPEPPGARRGRSRFLVIAIALGAVLLAALVVAEHQA
jgi:hypothetical protein